MEFSVFFNKLKIEDIYSNDAETMLIEYKKCCETENDYIQLYELKDILEVVNIYHELHSAYLDCSEGNIEPLFNEIELLSNLLEENFISCYSYAYYFYVYLTYIYQFDKYQSSAPKALEKFEIPEKIEWCNPRKFDYSKLNETTFGVKADTDNGLTKSFPNYKLFKCSENELTKYKGTKPYVIVPDTISTIRKSAFSGNKRIKMVIIPDSVHTIEAGAFEECENLNLVHLSKQIKTIPNKCFSRCKRLKYIIGENIVEVGEEAFNLCVSLTEINLDYLTVAHNKAFYGCQKLKNFDFVSNLSYIGDYAFSNCKINSLFLNDCDYLGTNAFASCLELSEVIINNNIENVGETPFYCCSNISHLEVRDSISFRLFDLLATNMEEFDSGDYKLSSVKLATLSPFICWNMKSLENIEVTRPINTIPNNAFQNCENLTDIILKNTSIINEINDYAFENCVSLTNLNIIFNGKTIGNNSFYNCSSISDFSFLNNVVSFGDNSLAHTNLTNFDFYNSKFEFIGKFAFANSYFPENLNIRLNGAVILDGAFHGVEIVNCLEIFNCNIDKELFYTIFEKTREEFVDNVTILSLITDYVASPYLFSAFNSSYIECNIDGKDIPEGLFNNCATLCSVKLNGTINNFGVKSFMGCAKLDYIDVEVEPNIVVSECAFMNCSSYEYPYFEQTLVIGNYAFYGSNITNLSLGNNIKYIGECAFGNCKLSPIVKLPFVGNESGSNQPFGVIFAHTMVEDTEVQVVGENKYYIPNNIECVNIDSEDISSNAFINCYFIKKIALPNVRNITDCSFNNCTSLIELSLGDKLEKFSAISLYGANKDIKINILNNNRFTTVDGSVYSSDLKIIYYVSNNNILDSVTVYKPYSAMNYSLEELRLNSVQEIDNNAFDIKDVKKITINNVHYIAPCAFINYGNLNEICISSDSNNKYEEIFASQIYDINISKMIINKVSVKSILKFFKNSENLNIEELSIINGNLKVHTFDGVKISKLILSNCCGSANVNSNIKNISCENCKPFNNMLIGDNEYNEITIINNEISEKEIAGIKCDTLNLKKIDIIQANAFKNSVINTLNIYGVETIDKGVFYECEIDNINIYDSSYICDDNCIYKDDQLIYYKPHIKNAKIPVSIKRVYNHSIDLINAISLEISGEINFDEHAVYNATNVKKLICNKSNLTRIADLFDDASNIKELVYEGDEIPNKYLSKLSGVKKINLNSSIKLIGDFAFSQNISLKEIVNFEKACDYGDFILMDCVSLEKILFNDNSNSVGYHLVEGCSNLKTIEIPLLEYYYNLNNDIHDILGEDVPNAKIIISKGDIPQKMFMNLTNSIVIKQSPIKIGSNAFENTTNITVKLNNTKYIGDESFKNSVLSRMIELKDCEYIGDNAFVNCKGIKEIQLFEKINYIGNNAFMETQLEDLSIKENPNYYIEQNCLFKNKDLLFYIPNSRDSAISINQNIDRVYENSFTNCKNLKSITFNEVKKFDTCAFDNCSNLVNVDLGTKASEISGFVFRNCQSITNLSLYQIKQGKNNCLNDYFENTNNEKLNSVKKLKIYSSVLNEGELECHNSLVTVLLSDKVENIPNKYFSKCCKLMEINIPSGCKIIGDDAFNGCKLLTTIDTYNSNVKTYGARAFANTSIKELKFNKNVTSLGNALLLNTPIEKLNFGLELKEFNCDSFSIENTITKVEFNETSFTEKAFTNKTNLKSISVNKYLGEEIPHNCFSNCTSLSNISIPRTYNTIKTNAFANCSSLTEIVIAPNVLVEKNAFLGCDGIIEFIYESYSDKFKLEYFGFSNEVMLKVVELKNAKLTDSSFENYKNIENVIVCLKQNIIPSNCFKNCSRLKTITIDGVNSISKSAFEGCTSLYLPEEYFTNIGKIDAFAFAGCKNLDKVILPNIKVIGKNAFEDCCKIRSISFGNTLKEIPENLCIGCSELVDVKLNSGLERIGKYAFSKTKIKKLNMYESIKYIDSSIFKDNKSSVKIIVPHKKYDTSTWAKDWNSGFVVKHKFLKFLNPKAKLVVRR